VSLGQDVASQAKYFLVKVTFGSDRTDQEIAVGTLYASAPAGVVELRCKLVVIRTKDHIPEMP